MKVLYISSFVYRKNSSAAIRNNKLIEGMVLLGNKVDVMTLSYPEDWTDGALVSNHINLNISSFLFDVFSNKIGTDSNKKRTLKKYLPKSLYDFLKNFVAFPDVDKAWLRKNIKIEDKYDVIISSSDTKTSHFVAEKIINGSNYETKWVQIWGDPWASDVNLDFLSRKYVSSHEHRMLNKADKVFYVSEITALEYKEKYPDISNKIYHVGRSYYKEVVSDKTVLDKKYRLFYPGSLNANRSISSLCKDIESFNLSNEGEIELIICGYQSEEVINSYGHYSFIEFLGPQTIEDVYKEFSKTDFLLFVDNGKSSTQIPGKIFDYYGTNLPIIALVAPGNKKMIDFLSKDERTTILEKGRSINMDFITSLKKSPSANEYYSPLSVAERFLNEL